MANPPSRRSLFSAPSSSKSKSKSSFLSPSRHELPHWRSPSPLSASIIPRPIVQSTYPSSPPPTAHSVLAERPTPSRSRQRELEADLQYLLDAQAEGLVKGLEGGGRDDATSTGSTTPTVRSVRSGSSRRVDGPLKKKPGLRSARKGLYSTMLALSAVKDDELVDTSDDLREKDENIEQIDAWERKKAGLLEASQNVESNEETVRVQRLRQQAETVESEIRELERQLEDRRVLHRKLMRQVSTVENEVQAKMASYTHSLKLLEEDVKRFLSSTPASQSTSTTPGTANGDLRQSVWHLPPKRRTLSLAREQYTHDRASLLHARNSITREKDALEEGAGMWKGVVDSVTGFERRMRDDMHMSASQAERQSQDEADARLRDLLAQMDSLIGNLRAKAEMAREREWNLLIAAIGAEVDALERGRGILREVLGEGEQDGDGDLLDDQHDGSSAEGNRKGSPSPSSGGEEIHDLDKSFETARPTASRRRGASSGGHSSSEDEQPGPELLFSREEIEVE